MKIAEKVKEFFHNEGIHSTTIQPEFVDYQDYPKSSDEAGLPEDCVLDCPKGTPSETCVQNTCCGPSKVFKHFQSVNNNNFSINIFLTHLLILFS